MPVIGGNTIDHNVAYAGQVADLQLRNKISRLNQTGESIAYGKGLVTEDEQSAKLPTVSSTAAEFNGVVVYELNRARRFGQTGAPSGQDMTLITKGVVWVTTLDTVTKDTPVYLRTGGVDAGDFSGVATDSVLIAGTKFLTPGSAGDLVKISLGGLGISDAPAPVPTPSAFVAPLAESRAWEMSEQLVDVDNLDGLLIQGYWEAGRGIMIGQGNSGGTDFRIYEGDNGKVTAQIGGNYTTDFADSVTGYVEILFSGTDLIYSVDGVEYYNGAFDLGASRRTDVTVLGGRIDGDGGIGFGKAGFIKDFTISQNGTVKFDATLADKDAGQVQASTVGSVTATMVNYDASVWVEYVAPDWYAYLSGSQAWNFGEKLIDVDNLDGTTLEVEFNTDSEGTMIGQCVGDSASREFQYFKFGDEVKLRIGGEDVSLGDLTTVGVHKLVFDGGNVDISLNDINVYSGVYPTGASREASAVTTISRRGGGNFKAGGALNFKITKNGTVTYENSLHSRDDRGLQQPTIGTAIGELENFNPVVWRDYYISDMDIDTDQVLLFMGASIMERSFDQTTRTEDAYLAQGLDIKTYCRALGGDTSLDTRIKTVSAIKELSKVTKQKIAFVHTGGNDASVYGPYPGGATDVGENITAIAQLFKDAGYKVIMTPISYRIPPASNPTQPYNLNIVDALVTQYADHSVDMYTFTLTSGNAYFGLAGGDGIHPSNPDGEILTVNYVVDNTYQYLQSI